MNESDQNIDHNDIISDEFIDTKDQKTINSEEIETTAGQVSTEEYKNALQESLNALNITVNDLCLHNFHYGHKAKYRNPMMAPYILRTHNGFDIFNLGKTIPCFNQAIQMLRQCVKQGGRVLFVGTLPQSNEAVKAAASACGQHFIAKRWLGGLLTNWHTVSKSIKNMKELDEILNTEAKRSIYTKRELGSLKKRYDKWHDLFEGIHGLPSLPDMMVVASHQEETALKEAYRLQIPTIVLLDSNGSPKNITYPIPGNDDSLMAVKLFCNFCAQACIVGLQEEAILYEEHNQALAAKKEAKKVSTTSPKKSNKPEKTLGGWASSQLPQEVIKQTKTEKLDKSKSQNTIVKIQKTYIKQKKES